MTCAGLPVPARIARRMDRTGASPVPPASSRTGRCVSRRKKLPLGPVNVNSSPTWARSVRYVDITPPGVSFTRNVSALSSGALLNEYERLSSVPGTAMLTYCPGRKANSSRFGISMVNETVLGESRVSSVSSPT